MNHDLQDLIDEEYCYLTTTGRVSGRPHEIEIWFGMHARTLYLLSGSGKSDWVKNLRLNPTVTVRIADHSFPGQARLVSAKQEEMMARDLLADKYREREADGSLSEWARTALPVAIDLSLEE
ncbi:MAG TPA: nitroreductase family deazaflavin-dependent oxidoreductase [Anaerolineales bacterium]|nr:nitroreductase family deazaflavin-dependent oxidoreductase [Anaerolineales bacterium]